MNEVLTVATCSINSSLLSRYAVLVKKIVLPTVMITIHVFMIHIGWISCGVV